MESTLKPAFARESRRSSKHKRSARLLDAPPPRGMTTASTAERTKPESSCSSPCNPTTRCGSSAEVESEVDDVRQRIVVVGRDRPKSETGVKRTGGVH
jgi:hypothetical protein